MTDAGTCSSGSVVVDQVGYVVGNIVVFKYVSTVAENMLYLVTQTLHMSRGDTHPEDEFKSGIINYW